MDSSNLGGIFQDAQLNPAKFYANAFKLHKIQVKQNKIKSTGPVRGSRKQARPRKISQIIGGECQNWKRGQLGKNLLDSFALIFAQTGPEGVVATILEQSSAESNIYTLWVARNFVRDCRFSNLAEEIGKWFKASELHVKGHHIHIPSPNNDLWTKILQNCYPIICIHLTNAYNIKENENVELDDTQKWIKSLVASKSYQDKRRWKEVLDALPPILDQLNGYFSQKFDPNNKGSAEECEDGKSAPTEFLDKITSLCYQLLESHKELTTEFFKDCCKTGTQDKWLKVFRRLIFVMASYRRAWYDMVRFKTDHESATLQIRCLPNSTYCEGNSIMLTEIFEAGVKMGIYERDDEREFKREYPALERLEKATKFPGRFGKASPRVHCEMRILDYVLENRDPTKFFNYIGCSKGPCWLCYHTLKFMAPGIGMRAPHWKLYPVWEPPRFLNSPPNRERFIDVLQILDDRIENLRRLAETRKRRPWEHRFSGCGTDCPGIEDAFLSPRTESMCQLEEAEKNNG
ncbi:hypothetical protein F5Y13DRAFT_191015 [Hypoxylon sp. FL1857]|nr:hypothetical protein F5Y13DRAFT_191015 [Hypoxylon sp. FL1857]